MNKVKEEYLRAKGIANKYSIGLSTVWKMAKDGKITPIKISERVTVFSIVELDRIFNITKVA